MGGWGERVGVRNGGKWTRVTRVRLESRRVARESHRWQHARLPPTSILVPAVVVAVVAVVAGDGIINSGHPPVNPFNFDCSRP